MFSHSGWHCRSWYRRSALLGMSGSHPNMHGEVREAPTRESVIHPLVHVFRRAAPNMGERFLAACTVWFMVLLSCSSFIASRSKNL